MARNPGKIIKLSDGRHVIMRTKQPLVQTEKKVVFELLDSDLAPQTKDGKQLTLIKSVEECQTFVNGAQVIGFID